LVAFRRALSSSIFHHHGGVRNNFGTVVNVALRHRRSFSEATTAGRGGRLLGYCGRQSRISPITSNRAHASPWPRRGLRWRDHAKARAPNTATPKHGNPGTGSMAVRKLPCGAARFMSCAPLCVGECQDAAGQRVSPSSGRNSEAPRNRFPFFERQAVSCTRIVSARGQRTVCTCERSHPLPSASERKPRYRL
jgi:hypothetical protein